MNNKIEKIKKVRQFIIDQVAPLTVEQLNKIPVGFDNNIIWNMAHLICAQQGICYLRGGQQAIVPEKFIAPFFTGTKPGRMIEQDEIQEIKNLLISSIDQFQSDYDKKIFGNYTPSPNVLKLYSIELNNIEDALEFILYHEGYHSGYILALKRLVAND